MDDKNKDRIAVARRASSLLRRNAEFRDALKFVASDGTRPVVVATLFERVADVFGRLERSSREGANLVVGAPTGDLIFLTARRDDSSVPFGAAEDDCPIHPDSEMAMLVAYLLTRRGHPIRCQLVMPEFAVELDRVPVSA